MSKAMLMAHCGTSKITREELSAIPTPESTKTHQTVPHHQIVDTLIESLSFRRISVVRDEYAISPDGMKMFGVLDLNTEWDGTRFSVGLRNSNDKSMRLGLVAGFRVMVCDNMAFAGDFRPMFHKHTRNLELIEVISIGVDKIQRHFESMKQQVMRSKEQVISDNEAKLIIYDAFVARKLHAPRTLLPLVHRYYFTPQFEEFLPRTLWSLSNAFTSAFKSLKPVSQFQATAKLAGFLEGYGKPVEERRELGLVA